MKGLSGYAEESLIINRPATLPPKWAQTGAAEWFDENLKRLRTDIDNKLASTNNWLSFGRRLQGWRLVKTRLDFWGRVERFLDKQIGAGATGK